MGISPSNPCKISTMYSFSQSQSKASLSFRKALFLCFLLIGLISTQWVGLWHSISHTNAQIQKVSALTLEAQDESGSNSHGGIHCQLLDNLALASFIHNATSSLDFSNPSKHLLNKVIATIQPSQVELSYRSRAPPTTIL